MEGFNIRRAGLIVSSTTRCNSKCCFRNEEICRELDARMVLCQVEFVKNFTSTRLVPQELRPIYDKVVGSRTDQRGGGSAPLSLHRHQCARADRQHRSGAKKRESRHLYPESIHQLFEHLHSLVPVLRLWRQETRSRMRSNWPSPRSSRQRGNRCSLGSPRFIWWAVFIRLFPANGTGTFERAARA